MEFKSIIVWPIIRPDQDYTRKELWFLKQEIKKVFFEYGTPSCAYYSRLPEPTIHGYQENFAIVDFKQKEQARKALRAIEAGQVCINKTKVTGKAIELYDCSIAKLPDECLLKIFTYLSVYEQLKLQKICKQWKRASQTLWRNVTKIDLRQKDAIYKDKNYIVNSGAHLKDIYCYDDHGLKIIGKHCPNVENVAVEFRKYTKRNGLDRTCITFEMKILPRFKHLTRLMLKIRHDQYTYFDFLRHLPETMVEIHLLNDIKLRAIPNYGLKEPKIPQAFYNYGRKLLDLSRFINLQALTLKAYIFDENSLIGLDKLKKLTSLCLDDSMLSQASINELKYFTNLQHLSLRKVELYYNDAWTLLNRNQNLNYLALPLITEQRHYNDIWLNALELQQLKTLCWVHVDSKIREIGESTTIENMELHDVYISDRRFVRLIDSFPNLKIVKRTSHWGSGSHYVTSSVQYAVINRPNRNLFTFYPGKMWKNQMEWYLPAANYDKDNFQHFDEVRPEDGRILRCGEWHGWYIDDDPLKSNDIEQNFSASSLQHNSPCNLDVSRLSDDHLSKIFSYLSIDDKLNCSKVCKRWQRIINEQSEGFVKFDVRQLSTHSNKSKCLCKYGKHFENVFSYKSCGLLSLKKYCPNVKNLAVDFSIKRCDCKTSSKEFYSINCLGMILENFRNLTRLMIKDVTAFRSNIFECLPNSLEELHVFNRNTGRINIDEDKDRTLQRRNVCINLSKLKNLRALTLVQADLPVDELFDESVSVIGLENMKNLVHLRLSGDIFIVNPDSLIRDPLPLEYLSLTQSTISIGTLPFLMRYENIQYLDIADSFSEIEKNHLSAILLLERLRLFRMAITSPQILEEEEEWEFDFIPALPCLEILDCQGHPKLLKRLVESAIVSSRNLKLVNVPVSTVNDITELLTIAESAMMSKNNSALLNIFIGIKGYQICNNWRLSAERVRLRDIPPLQYYKLLDRLFWGDWNTTEGIANIDVICKDLIKSIN